MEGTNWIIVNIIHRHTRQHAHVIFCLSLARSSHVFRGEDLGNDVVMVYKQLFITCDLGKSLSHEVN